VRARHDFRARPVWTGLMVFYSAARINNRYNFQDNNRTIRCMDNFRYTVAFRLRDYFRYSQTPDDVAPANNIESTRAYFRTDVETRASWRRSDYYCNAYELVFLTIIFFSGSAKLFPKILFS